MEVRSSSDPIGGENGLEERGSVDAGGRAAVRAAVHRDG